MNQKNNNRNTGVGIGVVLQILFIAFKLTDIITWSWFWVLSPMWIYGFIILLYLIIAIIMIIKYSM